MVGSDPLCGSPLAAAAFEQGRIASVRLAHHLVATPLVQHNELCDPTGSPVWAKLESEQRTLSFKYRGALNKALAAAERGTKRLVTGSTGNHGLAVARACGEVGLSSRIFVCSSISARKCALLEQEGAELVMVPSKDPLRAEQAAREHHSLEAGVEFVSPYNDLEMIAGHATLVSELLTQLPQGCEIDLYCATGGGGLAAGLALGLSVARRRDSHVVSCAPLASDVLANAVRRGYVLEEVIGPTLSDATAGNIESDSITLPLCSCLVDQFVTVDERQISTALQQLQAAFGPQVEGAAAVALAGMLKHRSTASRDGLPVVVVCGGNGYSE